MIYQRHTWELRRRRMEVQFIRFQLRLEKLASDLVPDGQILILAGAAIVVFAMIVGLSEVALNVANELEDVGSSFGSITQSYHVNGLCGHMGHTGGSCFTDKQDFCDNTCDVCASNDRSGEGSMYNN